MKMTTEMPWFHRTVIAPTTEQDRECVRHVQQVLEVPITGVMDPATRSGILTVQHVFNLPPTGAIDQSTAQQIERLRRWETC